MPVTLTWQDLKTGAEAAGAASPLVTGQPAQQASYLLRLNDLLAQTNVLLANVNNIKNNPMLQKIIAERMGKKMGNDMKPNQYGEAPMPVAVHEKPVLNEETIYNTINNSLEGVQTMYGDVSVSELRKLVASNKEIVKELIKQKMSEEQKKDVKK